jgi:hypothetical protein
MKQNYIMTERPEDMSFEVYKAIKNHQKKKLKEYKQGKFVKMVNKKSDSE